MKKLVLYFIIFILSANAFTVRANTQGQTPRVHIRVEGALGTLAEGYVIAHTFQEALTSIANIGGLVLTYVYGGAEVRLIGVEENEGANGNADAIYGEWLGFIERGGAIIRQDFFLNLNLLAGDELVLYFGNPADTFILSHFTYEVSGNEIIFFAGSSSVNWSNASGVWVHETEITPIMGVDIHISFPGGTYIGQTDEDGFFAMPFKPPGVFTYRAEAYRPLNTPLIVKTNEYTGFLGFSSLDETVTRGEAVAFLLNMFGDGYDIPDEILRQYTEFFTDVDYYDPYYEMIIAAAAMGLVSGYGDGTFKPLTHINFLELCVLTAGLFPPQDYDWGDDVYNQMTRAGLPDWAFESIYRLYAANVLSDIHNKGWNDEVTFGSLIYLFESIDI